MKIIFPWDLVFHIYMNILINRSFWLLSTGVVLIQSLGRFHEKLVAKRKRSSFQLQLCRFAQWFWRPLFNGHFRNQLIGSTNHIEGLFFRDFCKGIYMPPKYGVSPTFGSEYLSLACLSSPSPAIYMLTSATMSLVGQSKAVISILSLSLSVCAYIYTYI